MDLWEQVAPQLSKEGGECQPPHKAAGIRRTSLFGGKRCKWVDLHGLGRAGHIVGGGIAVTTAKNGGRGEDVSF